MVIKNKKINEFLKKLYDEHSNEFVFRIRDEENIVYYNGLKAFTVKKSGKENIELELFEKTFKCNPTAIKEYYNRLDEYKNNLIDLCTIEGGISKICSFAMDKITFEIAAKFDESKIYKRLDEFCKKHNDLFARDRLEKTVKNEIDRIKKESISKKIKEKEVERTKIELIFNKTLTDAKKIIEVQFDFLKDMKNDDNSTLNDTIKGVEFSYKISSDTEDADVEAFIRGVKKAIDNYKGHDELEKKYQHKFMLSSNTKNLFEIIDKNKNVTSFEEEYYIIEKNYKKKFKKMDGNGRIDAIYIGYENKKVTDIYMIELKVNENVVGGNNGIHKHLDNIKDLFDEVNNEGRELFFTTMLNRFENRNKVLVNDSFAVENKDSLEDITYHFYTVIGFSDMPIVIDGKKKLIPGYDLKKKSHCNITIDLLNAFKDENKWSSLKQELLPNKYKTKEMSILKIVNDIAKKCNVELIFDINNWDKETYNPIYKSETKKYFKK